MRQANSAQRDFANRACHGSAARSHLRSGVVTAVSRFGGSHLHDDNGAGRRKRREFLGAGLLRQPGRYAATTWMVAGVDLLSHRRVGERQYRRVPRNHDRTIQSQAQTPTSMPMSTESQTSGLSFRVMCSRRRCLAARCPQAPHGLWQQRCLFECDDDWYVGPNSLHEVHCTPARHNGLWRPASNVRRALECPASTIIWPI